jgi:hypothetical protein
MAKFLALVNATILFLLLVLNLLIISADKYLENVLGLFQHERRTANKSSCLWLSMTVHG